MDIANHTPRHDTAHSLSRGASMALLLFIVIGCLVGIYAGLIIGDYATL